MSNNVYEGRMVFASSGKTNSAWIKVREGEDKVVVIEVEYTKTTMTVDQANTFAAHIMNMARRAAAK